MKVALLLAGSIKGLTWECDNGQQIVTEVRLRCNGLTDCDDGSDEESCLKCNSNQFQCPVDGEVLCISESLRCDNFQTCDGNEDELNCPESCHGLHQYYCPDTQCCINPADVCQSENYCECNHHESDYDYGFLEDYNSKESETQTSDFCATWDLQKWKSQFMKHTPSDNSQRQLQLSTVAISFALLVL